jgi:serine/threonine protein kinase
LIISITLQNPMNLEQFDFYELLGEGSFGEVYRARDRITGEIVSIKRIKISYPQQILGRKEEIEIMRR